ncbi:MAG: sensor histidine kinase [Chitinophagaceae bacterium]|nr:sensor histidine kinase [Chitinophagaceae bacterium]
MGKGELGWTVAIVYLYTRFNHLLHRMRIILLLVVSVFLLMPVHAQWEKRDSLLRKLPSAKEDTSKVMLLLRIADNYETINQDTSRLYLEHARQLATQLKFTLGLYHYYAQSAIVSFTKGEYDLAMQQSNDALATATALKDSGFVVNILVNTAFVYQYMGEYEKQLENNLQALEIIERKGFTNKMAPMYAALATAYYNLKQFNKSIYYNHLALNHTDKSKLDYPNRALASVGQSHASINSTDSAVYYFKRAIAVSIAKNDKYAEASIYGFMAENYANRVEFAEMLTISEKALSMAKELQSNQLLASSFNFLAYANYFMNNNAAANRYVNEALNIAIRDSLTEELKNIYIVQSYIAAKDGDYKTSLRARQQADSLQAAILNDQVVKTTTGLEKKYESAKKDKQIVLQQSELDKKQFLNYVLIGSASMLLLIFLFAYRNYYHKKKLHQQRITELEAREKLSATQAVLKGEEQERTRLAKDLHDGLGGMLSGIKYSMNSIKGNVMMTPENSKAFDRSIDMLDSSIQEMRRVAHNMMPETLVKFGLETALKDLCNDITQSGALLVDYQSINMQASTIDQTTGITIYRIVQELLNNTMKHGAATRSIVQLSKTNSTLSVTVEDDGKGFDPASMDVSKGIGWLNIRHRVEFLKGKLDINSQEGNGVSVMIEVEVQ